MQAGSSIHGMNGAAELRLELARDHEAPFMARAGVREFCQLHEIDGDARANVLLLVSEIVTNAVLHSAGDGSSTIRLSAQVDREIIRIDVADHGCGFTPKIRDPAQAGRGYGLFLVDRIASRWGIGDEGGTTVWFELAIGPEL
jgi:anti-sigma regulatory factor (Ser/Thr protein kinase)